MMPKPFRSAATFLSSVVLASTTLAASPVENVAQHFTDIDRNRDGVASGNELRGTLWARYDTDGDGEVSRIEFVSGRAYDKRYAELTPYPEKAWLALDWNADGYLSGLELDGKWERHDADGDGKVQKHEFITARTAPAVFPAPPADASTPPASPGSTVAPAPVAPAPVAPAPVAPAPVGPRPTYVPPPADVPAPPGSTAVPAPVAPAPIGRPTYVPPPADVPAPPGSTVAPAPIGRPTYVPPPAVPAPVADVPGEAAKLKSLWGGSLADAEKSDLFQYFGLVRVGEPAPFEAGMQYSYQPKQGPLRELVTVKIIESDDKRIVAADMLLAGSFVNNPKTDVFARDFAKSFIAQLTPGPHAAATRDLVNELLFGAPNQIRVDGTAGPKLPNPPTAAYQTYLGKRDDHEQVLGDVKLVIRSAQKADEWLVISFLPARETAM